MKLIYAHACLAREGAALCKLAAAELAAAPVRAPLPDSLSAAGHDSTALAALYRDCLHRLCIRQRYPAPDWSIVDRCVARELLATGTDPALVSPEYCVTVAQAFRAAIPISRITCAGLSAVPHCFPARPTLVCPTDSPLRATCVRSTPPCAVGYLGFAYTREYPIPALPPASTNAPQRVSDQRKT